MADQAKGVPPVTPKLLKSEQLARGQRADTGGEVSARMQNNYSKKPPVEDTGDDWMY